MSPNAGRSAMTGDELRSVRAGLGWTQAQMGDWLGVSRVEVARKEAGRSGITVAQSRALELAVTRGSPAS